MSQTLRCGQSIGVARALLTVVALGGVMAFMAPIFDMLESEFAAHVTRQSTTTGLTWTGQLADAILPLTLGIIALGTIVLAVFQRRRAV